MRNDLGQFIAGHSGNAGDRPKDEHRVAGGSQSFNTVNQLRILGRWMRC
jgi:hypothetical protein